MKTAYRTVTVVLLAVLAAGCGNEKDTELPADALVPVEIAGAGISAEVQTRATITGGSIGVFRTGANYTQQYEKYTYNNGWKPSANTIYVGGGDATVCAYYPYDDAPNRVGTGFTLGVQAWSTLKDLSYAYTTGVSNKQPYVSFAMKRAYARLKLSITRKANYVGNCNIVNVNVKSSSGNNFMIFRTLDIANGNLWGEVYQPGGWTHAVSLGNIAPSTTNTVYDVLVPPQPVSGGLTITLPIDGVNRYVTVPETAYGSYFSAGWQYSISLTITDVAVTINGNINIVDMVTDGILIQNNNPIIVIQ